MCRIEKKGDWASFRLHMKAMSNQASYNYVMLLKYFFMKDAVERTRFKGNVVWMDFGFNHGGKCYWDPDDFNFIWNPVLDDSIHLYARNNPDDRLSIATLMFQSDVLMGCPVMARSNKCGILWEYCKAAMRALLSLDAMDDDQQLLLMAYRLHPDDFTIHYSDWFLPLKENGGEHMKVHENYGKIEGVSLYQRMRSFCVRFLFGLTRNYTRPTPYNYGKRISKYAKKQM